MKSKSYWLNRAIDRQSTIDKLSQAELDEIRKIYNNAERDLTKMINEVYETYSKKTGIDISGLKKLMSYSETDKFWKSIKGKEMKQYVMQNYKSRITRLEALQAQLHQKCMDIAKQQEHIMNVAGQTAVKFSFSKTVYDTSLGINTDLGFATLDDRTIDTILKEKWLGSNYSDRVWKNTDLLSKNLQNILTKTIMTGASQSRAIMELRDRMGVEWYKAERLVRTEMNHFHNQAELEAYEEMGVEKYVFVATLDNRTSEICQELDGKVFKLEEAEEGVNYPPMHPYCRSTVRAYISEEMEKGLKRRARDENGKNVVIDNMSYAQWAGRNDQGDVLDSVVQNDQLRNSVAFTPSSKITEAQTYAEKFVDSNKFGYEKVNYKGLPLEVANEVNKTLDNFYNQFDVEKLSSINAVRPNTRTHKRVFSRGADMSFNRAVDRLYINTEKCNNLKKYAEDSKKAKEVIASFIKNKQLYYDKYKDRQDIIDMLNRSATSGRETVPDNISEAVYHELGHSIEKYVTKHANWTEIESNIGKFNSHISGYACTNEHEYIAESFVSYIKGESIVDPKLREAFDSIRRK